MPPIVHSGRIKQNKLNKVYMLYTKKNFFLFVAKKIKIQNLYYFYKLYIVKYILKYNKVYKLYIISIINKNVKR